MCGIPSPPLRPADAAAAQPRAGSFSAGDRPAEPAWRDAPRPRRRSSTTTTSPASRMPPRCAVRPTTTGSRSARSCARSSAARPARPIMVATVFAVVWVLAGIVLGWMYLPELKASLGPSGLSAPILGVLAHDLLCADHLLLRARPHGVALAGAAPDHPVDGRGRDAARRARDGGARIHRHRRPGDPPRGRRHGRRHRARAGARRRARDAGRQRGVGARARLQRQRSAHPRRCCRTSASSATPWSARPTRSATPSTASISISATTFRRSANSSPNRSTRRRAGSPTRWPKRASTSPARSATPATP